MFEGRTEAYAWWASLSWTWEFSELIYDADLVKDSGSELLAEL